MNKAYTDLDERTLINISSYQNWNLNTFTLTDISQNGVFVYGAKFVAKFPREGAAEFFKCRTFARPQLVEAYFPSARCFWHVNKVIDWLIEEKLHTNHFWEWKG